MRVVQESKKEQPVKYPHLRNHILDACFRRYDGDFASGAHANNKIDCDIIKEIPPLRQRVVLGMSKLVLSYDPEFIVAVPEGANWLAEDIAKKNGLHLVVLKRSPGDRNIFEFRGEEDLEECLRHERGVLVEDIVNRFANTWRTLAIPEIGSRIVAQAAILDRGDPADRTAPPFHLHTLITEPIPAMLPDASPLWRHAQEL